MSTPAINGATDATDRHTWTVGCADVFGRKTALVVTAWRGLKPGIGIHTPPGEHGFVALGHVPELMAVLNEARQFIGNRTTRRR